MEIGFRAHDIGKFDSVESLASTIETFKKQSKIQLALNKVIPSSPKYSEYTPEYITSVRESLAKHGVSVAIVGCYINPVHPDPEERNEQLRRFEISLSLHKEFGCPYIGTETGSLNPDSSYNPLTSEEKVFSTFLSSVERLLKKAESVGATVTLEAVARKNTICSAERMRRVMDTFKSDNLKVIYDPINLTSWLGMAEPDGSVRIKPSAEAIEKAVRHDLDLLAPYVVAVHAKNYVLDSNGWKIGNKALMEGVVDWAVIFKLLREYKIDVPVLLENLNPATLKETLAYLDTI